MPKQRGPLESFLTVFGDIKIFSGPLFMVYDPGSYRVNGSATRTAIETIQPGDILVRRYDNYLDGHFIPGYFSHAAMFLGDVTQEDQKFLALDRPKDAQFATGKQIVCHSIAEGVLMEDILQFCRCDGMMILRFPEELERTCEVPKEIIEKLPFKEGSEEKAIFDELNAGKKVPFKRAFAAIRSSALSMVGKEYDFDFNFVDFKHVSCTELVFYTTLCVSPFLGVFPQKKKVLFFQRSMIEPDAMVRSPLSVAWQSPSCDPKEIEALRAKAKATPPPAAEKKDGQQAA